MLPGMDRPDVGSAALAVLPFENLSEQSTPGQQDYFSRGFVEDLITDLSRFPELLVMASHSTARLGADDASSGSGNKLDYVLKGSLRRDASSLRVSTQLLTPGDGRVIWAERFDGSLERVFDVQDEILSQVAASLQNRINADLLSAARRKPAAELYSYDCWLRGLDQLRKGTLEADHHARELFQRALERDPSYARAHLGLSLSYFNEWSCQLWEAWDDNERHAYEHAQRASELDASDHLARVVLARVLLYRREFEQAEAHLERALSLNQNDADCLVQMGLAFGFLGRWKEGRALFERAVRLNPYHDPWYHAFGCVLSLFDRDYPAAIAHGTRTPIDTMVDLSATLAVAHAKCGELERARECVATFLAQFRAKITRGRPVEPGEAIRWVRHVNPFRDPADEALFADGLLEVGLEEGEERASIVTPRESRAFRKVGSLWQLRYDGRDVHVPDLKGCADIAALLASPGREVHCSELLGAAVDDGADDAIDAQARDSYRARIGALREALAEAEQHNDLGRAATLREELDALIQHLSQSLGKRGRSRKLGAPAERARSAVTWRIRSAIKKIEQAHPSLGRHLERAIRTGTYCAYDPAPDEPRDWQL